MLQGRNSGSNGAGDDIAGQSTDDDDEDDEDSAGSGDAKAGKTSGKGVATIPQLNGCKEVVAATHSEPDSADDNLQCALIPYRDSYG